MNKDYQLDKLKALKKEYKIFNGEKPMTLTPRPKSPAPSVSKIGIDSLVDYEKIWNRLKNKIKKAQQYYNNQNNLVKQAVINLIDQYIFDIEMEEIYKEGIDNGASEK